MMSAPDLSPLVSVPWAVVSGPTVSGYDYGIIVIYLVFLASMGWIFRRFTRGSKDYFAGGFRMTWWLLGASSFISNFSCWTFTGAAGIAYTYGFLIFGVYLTDVLGFWLSYAWFAQRFRQLRMVTAMDALRLRFGRFNEQFFTWIGFIRSLGFAAVWLVGLSIILSTAFHFPPVPVILVTGVVVVVIALVGGNWAVAASDFIQLLVLMSITIVVGVMTLIKVGGISAFLHQIPADHWKVLRPAGSIPYDWLYMVTALFSAIYDRNDIQRAAKYIPAKDSRHARRSALVPLFGYLIMPIFWFIPPLAAFTLAPHLMEQKLMNNPGEASYIAVCLVVLPQGLIGLMIAAMFSATIASMDVALNKNAGFFVKNFYQPLLRRKAGDHELVRAGEISTVVFGVLIIGLAMSVVVGSKISLFDAFLYLNAYLGLPLSIPMFLGMLIKRVPRWAGWGTSMFGILVTVFLYDFLPTAAGHALVAPWLGESAYQYAITNRFVMTNMVGVPLIMLFFWATKLLYREPAGSVFERDSAEFFKRMETPIDFEKEVGGDNTAAQAGLLGRIAYLYGAFIVALVLIPNTFADRVGIFSCALIPLGVGLGLRRYSRRQSAITATPVEALVSPVSPGK
jgi:Na+/proline symporter